MSTTNTENTQTNYKVWDEVFDSIDVNDKPSWDDPDPNPSDNSLKVPNNVDAVQMVEYVINNIINEPYLLGTARVKTLIKNIGNGLYPERNAIKSINMETITQVLESLLNNKASVEHARLNPESITKEDFFNAD